MAGVGKPLHLRLFLEGQEVPVVSAQVQFGLWAPAVASVQIVPLDEALDFKPRTMVHLFYLEEPKVIEDKEKKTFTREDLSVGMKGPLGDVSYKLFFCGEITGFSFVKTPMSRAVVLQCVDFSSYWDSLQATMMDYGPQGNAFVSKASLYASNDALFANVPTQGQAEKLRTWILGKAQTPGLENVGGLAGGILNMVEVMGGLRGHTLGVNDFFTMAEIRCHLLSQITAEDGDNTAQRLLDVSVFFDWIFNNLQNQSGQVSLRDMMKLLSSYIYYSFVPNPVAKFDHHDAKRTVKYGPKELALSSHRYFTSCLTIIQNADGILDPNIDFDLSAVQALASDVSKKLIPQLNEMKGIDPIVPHRANLLKDTIALVIGHANDSGLDPARRNASQASRQLWEDFQRAKESTKVVQPGGSYTVKEAARLRTQIFRPDCFMAAPPTCNVVFPEQYSQITYDRNFLDEVTRVEISFYNRVVGQDALTAQHFVEPHLLDMSKAVVAQLSNKWRVLMDHELHTGIIAREEWLPDSFSHLRQPTGEVAEKMKQATVSWTQRTGLHHFFKYRIGPRTLNVAGRFMPHIVCGFPGLVIQKPFYIPSNIPADQAYDRILKSENPAVELSAPPQFLGMVEGVSHSLSQDGGNTNFSMSHCRSHLGIDDEFVGKVLGRIRQQRSSKAPVWYPISYDKAKTDEKLKNFLLGCTPQSAPPPGQQAATLRELSKSEAEFAFISYESGKPKKTSKKVSVTASAEKGKTQATNSSTSKAPDPNDAAGKMIYVPSTPGTVTVGSKGYKGGTVKLIEVGAPYDTITVDGKVYFRNITVFEELNVDYETNSPVPVEYIVQPSWLSTSYDNENVGPKVYKPFFGCDSIVDTISQSNIGSIPERLSDKGMYVTTEEDEKAVRARLQDLSSKRNFYSIEKAVNVIAYLYGSVKSGRSDVTEFVETFTWRPVATKKDVLGSHDLALEVVGDKVNVLKGQLGYHSLSVRPEVVNKGKLTGLLDDPAIAMSRMNETQRKAMASSYDVRAEKLAKVMKYIERLESGARGFVG